MAPQPLSRVAPKASILLGNVGDYPMQRHPELAALVAEVIVSWANVESFHLHLFVELMGGPEDKATAVFLSIESRNVRSAAIQAVARSLPKKYKNLLDALLAVSKSHAKSRDKIAHHTWGDSPDLPDALLLSDPKHRVGELDRSKIFVYRENDFKQIIEANERLAGFGMNMKFILSGHPANRDNELYDQLCSEPEIRDRLNHPA